jgi:raffinose/stachyose/melibiose transport system permease protein
MILTKDFIFYRALSNTLYYLGLSVVMQLPMAFLLANILSGSLKGRDFFRNVIYLPVTFSGVAVSLMWYFIYHPQIGLLNQLIRLFGHPDFKQAWLASEKTALTSVTVSVAWKWVGYHMVIYLAGMTAIPSEIIESARVDGATTLQVVGHIVVPFLVPMIAVSTVLITTSSLKSFDSIWVMTQGGPNHATEVLASHMYTKAFAQLRYGYGSAISVILLLLCVGATVALQKFFEAVGGVEQ